MKKPWGRCSQHLQMDFRECSNVTSSNAMNLPHACSCLPMVGHFLVHRIYLSDFYVKHKFPCFRRKFGDESTLRAVDFRLEEKITLSSTGCQKGRRRLCQCLLKGRLGPLNKFWREVLSTYEIKSIFYCLKTLSHHHF